MVINSTGITRIVFVFKTFVVKVPNWHYSWHHFLKGILANIQENHAWKYNSGNLESGKSHLLCPVKWCSWGGWILIMERADMKRWENEVRSMPSFKNNTDLFAIKAENARLYSKWVEAGFGGDDKVDNYGYYKDRLVKIDYG